MNKTSIAASMLAYLNCAPQPTQVPIVDIRGHSVSIVEKGTKRVYLPQKEPSAKQAADFIVKTLEEKIMENSGAVYARGYIKFNTSHLYDFSYKFDPANVCELGSSISLFKGSLLVNFQDMDHVVNGNSTQTSIYFDEVPAFYIAKKFSVHQMAYNGLTGAFNFYAAFQEAQKFYEEMLLYTAEELKQKPENITMYGEMVSIRHKDRNVDKREKKLFQRYKEFLGALPKQQPIQPGKFFSLAPCNP